MAEETAANEPLPHDGEAETRLRTGGGFRAWLQLVRLPAVFTALADVAAGHAQVSVGTVLQALPHVKANRLRPLAVSGPQRQAVLPDVPTVDEAGLSGYDGDNWWGLLAPAGTPQAIVDKLSKTVADILAEPEMRRRLEAESATVAYLAPEPFGKFLASETIKWAELIKRLGIQAD